MTTTYRTDTPKVPSAITTTEELLALADERGNIATDRDVRVEVDLSVSGGLSVEGNLSVGRYLSVEGNLNVWGNLSVEGNLSVGRYLYVGDNLNVGSDLYVGGDLSVGSDLYVGDNLNVWGNLSVEFDLFVGGHLAWSHSSIPSVGGTMRHGAVRPPEWQRDHWSRRLGIELRGCYSDIAKQVAPHLDEWLAQDKWSETERWIIQSWKDAQEGSA